MLHDAVLARAAGLGLTRGRDVGTLAAAAVEIGAGAAAFTVAHTGTHDDDPHRCAAAGVSAAAVRPFDPPLRVPVHVLLPTDRPDRCGDALVDAFGDR